MEGSLITDLEHSKNLNTFRSVIDIMISSSDDELPDIPGTRFPWMDDGGVPSSSSKSPRKPPKRPRVSAVQKERNTYKDPKKKPIRMDISSEDDDFVNPQPGSSKSKTPQKTLSAEELRKMKQREWAAKSRAKKTEAQKKQVRDLDAQRRASKRANETPEEHQQRNQADA